MKLIKHIYRLFRFSLYLNRISNYSDEKLETQFRKKIHSVENAHKEKRFDFLSTMTARVLFIEARKRGIISQSEIDWAENVLYNKPKIEERVPLNKKGNTKDELLDVIRNRRSVRSWTDEEVGLKKFRLLIDSARWAPSSCNRQPWHFLITQDEDKIDLLYKARGQKIIKDAPYCILVLINTEAYQYNNKSMVEYYMLLDAAASIQNLLLMAHSLGLGACWINLAPNNITKKSRSEIHNEFKIPKNYELITLIPIGKTRTLPPTPGRKDIENIMHIENF